MAGERHFRLNPLTSGYGLISLNISVCPLIFIEYKWWKISFSANYFVYLMTQSIKNKVL